MRSFSLRAHRVIMVDAEWSFPKNGKAVDEAADEATEQARLQELDNISKVFSQLFSQFIPAMDFQEADLHMSSEELFNKIQAHYPSLQLSSALIYEMMLERGFKFLSYENKVEFVWLLKKRPSDVL